MRRSRCNGFLDGFIKEAGISASLMKSIDKLNNAVIKKGKQVAQSEIGQKALNSGAGKKVMSTIDKAQKNNQFIGNITGYNQDVARKAVDARVMDHIRMETKNPTFRAYDNTRYRSHKRLSDAQNQAVSNSKYLTKTKGKIDALNAKESLTQKEVAKRNKLSGKYNKKLDKATKPQLDEYNSIVDQFKATDEYKTNAKIVEDIGNLGDVYRKAMRDTRNSRRALTGGAIAGGIALPTAISKRNQKQQEQEQLNQARMSYYY